LSTLRERFERGEFDKPLIDFFKQHRGSVPLCCYECKKWNKEWYFRCHTLKNWCREKTFRKKCFKCQKEIEELLDEKGYL